MASSYGFGLQVASVISIIFSSSVVSTAVLFPSLRRDKIFLPIIAMISFCDIVGNIWYTLNIHSLDNGTALCTIEGFFNLFVYPVSWLYTTLLAYLLRCLLISNFPRVSAFYMHFSCWCFPLMLTLLQLTTNYYGLAGSSDSVCSLGGNALSRKIWHSVTYEGLWIFCCLLMFWWCIEIRFLRPTLKESYATRPVMVVVRVLMLYPTALFLLWLPYVCYTLIEYINPTELPTSPAWIAAFTILKIMNGAVTALIFFLSSSDARQKWVQLASIICSKADDSTVSSFSTGSDNSVKLASLGGTALVESGNRRIISLDYAGADFRIPSNMDRRHSSSVGIDGQSDLWQSADDLFPRRSSLSQRSQIREAEKDEYF